MPAAIGLVEVEGVAGIVVALDAALKAASVEVIGWESIGGFTTVFFAGSTSDVEAGLNRGHEAAANLGVNVVSAPITQPVEQCFQFVTMPLQSNAEVREIALGLVETHGYAAHVYVCDEMVKTSDVEVVNVLTVHNRVVCSMVQGEVGAVRESVARAEQCLSDYTYLRCTAVLPQPRVEVLQTFSVPEGRVGNA